MAVWRQQVADDVWVQMDISTYQLINNTCVLNQLLSQALYKQLEVRVADEPNELVSAPSDTTIVAGIADEIVAVANNEDNIVIVANNDANVTLVGDDLALGKGTNQPTDSSILNALTNADIAIANAALTAADVVTTNADVVLTNADVVTAEASKEFANDWATSSLIVDDGVNPPDYSAKKYAEDAAAYTPTNNKTLIPVSKELTGTLSLSITPTHTEATTTTTADYVADNIIQVTGTGDFYTCILASTTGELLTNATYFTLSNADVETSSLKVGYANGYGDNGAVNTSESFTDGAKTLVGLTASSMNYPYTTEGDVANINFTTTEPVFGTNNKRTSAVNPDVFVDGKWYNSTNGDEKVTNGTFDTDITGVVAEDAVTIAWDNGTLKLTSTGASGRFANYAIDTSLLIGKTVRFTGDVVAFSPDNNGVYLSVANSTRTKTYGSLFDSINGVIAEYIEFVVDEPIVWVSFVVGGTAGDNANFDNLSIFETNIEPDTAYTTPRTYLPNIVETDSANKPALLHEWQPATLVEKSIDVEDLRVSGGFDLGQKWINVISERALGVEEFNASYKPIDVSVTVTGVSGTPAQVQISVGDEEEIASSRIVDASGTTLFANVNVEVPPRTAYTVSSSSGGLSSWKEKKDN